MNIELFHSKENEDNFVVRDWIDGSTIFKSSGRDTDADVWSIGQSSSLKSVKQEALKYDSKLPIGQAIAIGNRFYQVIEPKYTHLTKKWGASSIFVTPIEEWQYDSLTRKA